MEQPQKIIEAFDQCLIYVFGQAFARENPHKSDMEIATIWTQSGLSIVLATMVFYDRMNYMHERYLKSGHLKDRQFIPHSLKIFSENIESAIRRQTGDGEFDLWEREISKWRSRCNGWLKNKALWRTEMWGPEPFSSGCRAPHLILRALKKKIEPDKDYEKMRTRALDKRFEHLIHDERS